MPRDHATNRLLVLAVFLLALPLPAQKFFPDDPLEKAPEPMPVSRVEHRGLNEILEYVDNAFGVPGEQHPPEGVIPAMGVNTLGEVPDGPWYVKRHARKRLTVEQLTAGPGGDDPPSMEGTWEVLVLKRFGLRPGLLITDVEGEMYLLRFDPRKQLEMMTGADAVTSRFFHALGYWTTEDYIVYFDRSQLRASEAGEDVSSRGKLRQLLEEDIDKALKGVARDKVRGYRALALRVPGGKILGPSRLFGARSDDPNDIVPHEHRRDLRGLYVIAAWLSHTYTGALTTMDFLAEEGGVPHIRHYQIDFIGTLGSGYRDVKEARSGYAPMFDWDSSVKNLFSFGIRVPAWQRAVYPKHRSIGRIEYDLFDPEKWTPDTTNSAFENRLPDDDFWAAAQVMAFTDDDIRTIVKTGQYSDPEAEQWLIECLIERRNKIGRTYFEKVLPLDQLRIEDGQLKFDDLGVRYGFVPSRQYTVAWSGYQNETDRHNPIGAPRQDDFRLPPVARQADPGFYLAAKIFAGDPEMSVTAYVRKEEGGGYRVVGIDRD